MYRGNWSSDVGAENGYAFSIEGGPVTTNFNGEPVGGIYIGYTSFGAGYNTFISSYTSYIILLFGGFDFSTGFSELSGTSCRMIFRHCMRL